MILLVTLLAQLTFSQQNETALYKPVAIINSSHQDCFERGVIVYINGASIKIKLIDHDRMAEVSWYDLAWLAEHFCRKPSECYRKGLT